MKRTETFYYDNLSKEINEAEYNWYQIGKNDLLLKFDVKTKNFSKYNNLLKKKTYKFNQRIFNDEYESKQSLILPIEIDSNKKRNITRIKTRRGRALKINLFKNESTKIKKNIENKENINDENSILFEKEIIPIDDEIGKPQIKTIDISDNEMEKEELENNDLDNNPFQANTNNRFSIL